VYRDDGQIKMGVLRRGELSCLLDTDFLLKRLEEIFVDEPKHVTILR
jgi:hypothetical protein